MTRRCALYARYSSDLQRESSIEDQIRQCREYAARQDWPIVEEYVVADRAVSGAAVAGRDALQRLVDAAKKKPRPVDCVLIDDTSRLARDLPDALRILDILKFYGVTVVSVTQGIDSSQANARQLFTLHGMMDEQYLTGLRDKVYRGQEGRALQGLITGGRCYGYRNVPIEDSTRIGKYGRPAVLGVRLEIIEAEAAVVRRLFTMYAGGAGQGAIAVQLNREGISGPNGPWSRYTIHEMLANERYRGVQVWGRTQKARNPETGRKVSRATPESRRRRVDVPGWRIVPEELWLAVQERRKQAQDDFHRLGGMTRTECSRRYLFSGVLMCGNCGGSMVIATGSGKRGYVKYGCHVRKQSGMCDNALMIRQDRLEEQLLAAIERRVLNPAGLDYVVRRCEEEVKTRLAEMERNGAITTVVSLQKKRDELQAKRANLVAGIECGGNIPVLVVRLGEIETESKRVEEAIAAYRPLKPDVAVGEIRGQVMKSVMQLRELLTASGDTDFTRAKVALARHLGKLVLTPVMHDGRPVYKVSGNVSIGADTEKCRMQLVARDGIELPPTTENT
jgi:site-specific DNA recombinase